MIISELSVQQIFKYLTAANWQLIFIYFFILLQDQINSILLFHNHLLPR